MRTTNFHDNLPVFYCNIKICNKEEVETCAGSVVRHSRIYRLSCDRRPLRIFRRGMINYERDYERACECPVANETPVIPGAIVSTKLQQQQQDSWRRVSGPTRSVNVLIKKILG